MKLMKCASRMVTSCLPLRVRVDVQQARKLQRDGLGLRPIAKRLKRSVNTLQN
jgi:hypothetical protein